MSWVRTPLAAPITPQYRTNRESRLPRQNSPALTESPAQRAAASQTATVPCSIFAGTSGWAYTTWKPGFYPAKLPAKGFLAHYASRLNSVEVNYTFRKLPTTAMLEDWLAATPTTFRFSFKAPQRITHFSRLVECAEPVARLCDALAPASSAGRLGLLLFQLPPNFKANADRLAEFLKLPAFAGPEAPRVAFEFRHESWFTEPVYSILRRHNAALCIAEGDELQTPDVQCACTHACYRLRRTGGYTEPELAAFARKVTALAEHREVYIYLRHEDEPTGALNAETLLRTCSEYAAA
ncbi:MAG: DUF72 domain-containing protein [Acidobacteriaceae bacterium]